MNSSRLALLRLWILAALAVVGEIGPACRAAGGVDGVTAVASQVSKDYVRATLSDGSFGTEYYAFAEGGSWGGPISDLSIDKLHFMDVARVLAPPLAGQNYFPATDPKATKLLIMVYWGTTEVPPPIEEDPLYQTYIQDLAEFRMLMEQGAPDEANAVLTSGLHVLNMANHVRDQLDFKNAAMIGYSASGLIGTEEGNYLKHTALGIDQKDQVAEIEENRYFVVLMAYDFQLLWKGKKHKLLWETRFSISQRHNQFDKALPVMARYASQYFGQPSKGLERTRVPEGTVEVKPPTLIEFLTEPKK
jgi:hypothetical protein